MSEKNLFFFNLWLKCYFLFQIVTDDLFAETNRKKMKYLFPFL